MTEQNSKSLKTAIPLLMFYLLLPLKANADDCLARTWHGTIGSIPVTLEFDHIGANDTLAGRYYYRTNLNDLLLVPDEQNKPVWNEIDSKGNVTGHITTTCSKDELIGEWTSPDGMRKFPINANPLRSRSYDEERLEAITPIVVARKSTGALRYELYKAYGQKTVTGLRLIGDAPGIAKINTGLRHQFQSFVAGNASCKAYGQLRMGTDHGYFEEWQPALLAWNKAYVVIGGTASAYCGGAHPYGGSRAVTYNTETGEQENVASWLIDDYQKDIDPNSKLGELLANLYRTAGKPVSEDCEDHIVLPSDATSIWPTSLGMVFQPWAAYALGACIKDVVVPYKTIYPYLSPRGKAAVKHFLTR